MICTKPITVILLDESYYFLLKKKALIIFGISSFMYNKSFLPLLYTDILHNIFFQRIGIMLQHILLNKVSVSFLILSNLHPPIALKEAFNEMCCLIDIASGNIS